MSHTFAILDVDESTYEDIKQRLIAAGYQHAIMDDRGAGEVIDMNGLAISSPSLQQRVSNTRQHSRQEIGCLIPCSDGSPCSLSAGHDGDHLPADPEKRFEIDRESFLGL